MIKQQPFSHCGKWAAAINQSNLHYSINQTNEINEFKTLNSVIEFGLFDECRWIRLIAATFPKYDNSNSVKEYLKAFDNTKCYANGINVL